MIALSPIRQSKIFSNFQIYICETNKIFASFKAFQNCIWLSDKNFPRFSTLLSAKMIQKIKKKYFTHRGKLVAVYIYIACLNLSIFVFRINLFFLFPQYNSFHISHTKNGLYAMSGFMFIFAFSAIDDVHNYDP